MQKREKFKVLESKIAFHGKIYDVVTERLLIPSGKEVERSTVMHNGAVVIIPQLADGNMLLIRQYRHAIRKTILEFPAGTLAKGQDPLDCAKHELAEEVGHKANEWTGLGELYPAPGICNEVQHCFLAKDLSPHKEQHDEDEIIEVLTLSVPEVEETIKSGELADGKSIAVFARARQRGLL